MGSWRHLLDDCRGVAGFPSQRRLHDCLTHQLLTLCVVSRLGQDTQCKKTIVNLMCEAIVEAALSRKSGNTVTIVKQMTPAAHMAVMPTFTDTLGKMPERKKVIALYTMRCFAGMQPENLSCVCNYMASPQSTVPSFRKLAKELRARELWWHHFGHPDMQVQCIHPSRCMLLPGKLPAFRCGTL